MEETQRNGNADIRYLPALPDRPVPLICDRRQISQVLTNILKNAAEAIEGRDERPGQALPPGEISLTLRDDGATVSIIVTDNGSGLSDDWEHRPGHYGLRWLAERVEGLQGSLHIENTAPHGVRLTVNLPHVDATGVSK